MPDDLNGAETVAVGMTGPILVRKASAHGNGRAPV
jgi:hypothetical protein